MRAGEDLIRWVREHPRRFNTPWRPFLVAGEAAVYLGRPVTGQELRAAWVAVFADGCELETEDE